MRSSTDSAYVAGFVDGEGCLSLIPRKSKKGLRNGYFSRVGIANTNKEILSWIQERYGGNLSPRKIRSSKHKQAWALYFGEVQAEKFLNAIYPWIKIKKRQAEIILSYRKSVQDNLHYPDKNGLSQELISYRDGLYTEIRQLNTKGPNSL